MTLETIIQVYGEDWCGDTLRAKEVLANNHVAYEFIDMKAKPESRRRVQEITGKARMPVILFPDGTHLVEPSDEVLLAKLGKTAA